LSLILNPLALTLQPQIFICSGHCSASLSILRSNSGVPLYIISSPEVLLIYTLEESDCTDDLSVANFASTPRTRCVKLLVKSLTLPKYTVFIVSFLLGAYLCQHDDYTSMSLFESTFKVLKLFLKKIYWKTLY
jgi:hypothetical protein